MRSSRRSPPTCRTADWVRLPPSLWTELRTTSAPRASAFSGTAGGEGEVRAPGLVDDQRHVVRVGDLGQRGDVGDGAEVGGGDDEGGDRVGVLGQRAIERVRHQAVGDAHVDVELGGDEVRPHAVEDEAVDHRGVDVALHDRGLAEVRERHADRVVAAGGAVVEEPAALRAPGLGGEPLALLERRRERVGPDVDALEPGRQVEQQRLARRSPRSAAGSAPRPPLWPGMWKRPGSRVARAPRSASRYGVSLWSIAETVPANRPARWPPPPALSERARPRRAQRIAAERVAQPLLARRSGSDRRAPSQRTRPPRSAGEQQPAPVARSGCEDLVVRPTRNRRVRAEALDRPVGRGPDADAGDLVAAGCRCGSVPRRAGRRRRTGRLRSWKCDAQVQPPITTPALRDALVVARRPEPLAHLARGACRAGPGRSARPRSWPPGSMQRL